MADEKVFVVSCSQCGRGVEMKPFFMSYRGESCEGCKTRTDYDKSWEIVTCPRCSRRVVMDPNHNGRCPSCSPFPPKPEEREVVACPRCKAKVYYKAGETSVTCSITKCGHVFNPAAALAERESVVTNDAPDITMTGDPGNGRLIYRCALEQLPLNSRIVAEPGFVAVVMQGGKVVTTVDGSSVKLSDTELVDDAWEYDGAMQKLVNVVVYYVRTAFHASFLWGGSSNVDDGYNVSASISHTGAASIDRVTDAVRFLEFLHYDTNAGVESFGMVQVGGDGQQPGVHAVSLRNVIRNVCQTALQAVRDSGNYMVDQLVNHQPEMIREIEEQANAELEKWGVCIRDLTASFKVMATQAYQHPLLARVGGPLKWKTEQPILIHTKEGAHVYAKMFVRGTVNVTVDSLNTLRRCMDAARWQGPDAELARREMANYVGEILISRCADDIQRVIEEADTPLYLLQPFMGYLASQVSIKLNKEDDYFSSRGLSANNVSVLVEMGEKSPAYQRWESAAEKVDEIKAKELVEAATREHDRKTDEGNHQDALDRIKRQQELDALRRKVTFETWQDQQRMAEAEEAAAYARQERQRLQKQEGAISEKMHEKKLYDLMQEVEQSKLGLREKLDAYDRLHRSMAFQDEMAERDACMDAAAREERIKQALKQESSQAMADLSFVNRQRDEELELLRFKRAMELRRQKMEDEAEKMKMRFEHDRALAKARQEADSLRMILNYITKNNKQELTAEAMKLALAQADRSSELKAARERLEAEKNMTDRAMDMLDQLNQMQKDFPDKRTRTLIEQLQALKEAVQKAPAPQDDMSSWLDKLLNNDKPSDEKTNATRSAQTFGGDTIICSNCGTVYSVTKLWCPTCKRKH